MPVSPPTAIHGPEPVADQARALHAQAFEADAERVALAPGQVRLLGSHLEYNHGVTLSVTIDRFVAVAARREDRPWVRLRSEAYEAEVQFSLRSTRPGRDWADPIRGLVAALQQAGHKLGGFSLAIAHDLPVAAGVSSSAGLEVAVLLALRELFGLRISLVDMARTAQRAEHRYLGVRAGLMEPLVSLHGQAGQVLALDLRDLSHRLLPIDLSGHRLVLVHSETSSLSSVGYNERKEDCAAGVAALARTLPSLHSLRDIGEDQLLSQPMPPKLRQRCLHIVQEMRRVREAEVALLAGDLKTLGSLMYSAQESARQLYEVSTGPLDLISDVCRAHPQSLGGCIAGPGFGGVSLHLLPVDGVESFVKAVDKAYAAQLQRHPQIMVCGSADGALALSQAKAPVAAG